MAVQQNGRGLDLAHKPQFANSCSWASEFYTGFSVSSGQIQEARTRLGMFLLDRLGIGTPYFHPCSVLQNSIIWPYLLGNVADMYTKNLRQIDMAIIQLVSTIFLLDNVQANNLFWIIILAIITRKYETKLVIVKRLLLSLMLMTCYNLSLILITRFKTKRDIYYHVVEEFIFFVFVFYNKFVFVIYGRICFGTAYKLRIVFIFLKDCKNKQRM